MTRFVRIFLSGIILSFSLIAQGQNRHVIDSLSEQLQSSHIDIERCHLYLQLGEALYSTYPDSAMTLWHNAKELAFHLQKQPNRTPKEDSLLNHYLAVIANNMGYIYYKQGNIEKAVTHFNEAVQRLNACGDSAKAVRVLGNLAAIEYRQGHAKKAIEDYKTCLAVKRQIGDKKEIAITLGNIGAILRDIGNISEALKYAEQALEIKEKLGNKKTIASSLNNMGSLYMSQEDYQKALEYFKKSLALRKDIDDKLGMSYSLSNIGSVYRTLKQYDKALKYYHKSLALREAGNYKKEIAQVLNNIGLIHLKENRIDTALQQFSRSLDIGKSIHDVSIQAEALINIATIYLQKQAFNKARQYAKESYTLSKQAGFPDVIQQSASLLKQLALQQHNYQDAYRYYTEEMAMRDSIFNKENYKKIQKQQARYEYEKKLTIDSIAHVKELKIRDLEIKNQTVKRKSLMTGIALLGVILLIVGFSYLQKRHDNILLNQQNIEIEEKNEQLNAHAEEMRILNENLHQQNEEILLHREKVQQQKQLLEESYLHINQSIDYAKRLQEAILPSAKTLKPYIDDAFLFFQPKDKVSGDFYWWTHVEERLVLAVSDCTGHGVPGAFMSMLGISFLREIVMKEYITHPGIILRRLRKEIIKTLKQDIDGYNRKDGMDMALISIDYNALNLQYSGANNSLYIAKKKQLNIDNERIIKVLSPDTNHPLFLYEIKPDKMPIAIYDKMPRFATHQIPLHKGDIIYLATDGFASQFGGARNRKFKSKNLKYLLWQYAEKSLAEQHQIITTVFNDWKDGSEQVDDVTVIGIKI